MLTTMIFSHFLRSIVKGGSSSLSVPAASLFFYGLNTGGLIKGGNYF